MKLTTVLNEISLDDFSFGKILVEYMLSGNNISLIVEFDNDNNGLFNLNGDKQKYFKSIDAFINHIKNSVSTTLGDRKNVGKQTFDPKTIGTIKRQINTFIKRNPDKARSLTFDDKYAINKEKHSSWDMELHFRRSSVDIKSKNGHAIKPKNTGNGEFGRVIGNNEIEQQWNKKKLDKHISNF